MGKKPKITRDTVPENFTFSFAPVDALPVLFFGGSMVLIGLLFRGVLFLLTNTAAQAVIFAGILLLF